MAAPTLSVPSPSPQPNWFTYSGVLINSLLAIVERAETRIQPTGPLTIDEVLDRVNRRAI
jgi:hypothetical protein